MHHHDATKEYMGSKDNRKGLSTDFVSFYFTEHFFIISISQLILSMN